jgi:hypothetical protein
MKVLCNESYSSIPVFTFFLSFFFLSFCSVIVTWLWLRSWHGQHLSESLHWVVVVQIQRWLMHYSYIISVVCNAHVTECISNAWPHLLPPIFFRNFPISDITDTPHPPWLFCVFWCVCVCVCVCVCAAYSGSPQQSFTVVRRWVELPF